MRQYNFSQTLKLQSAVVTLNIRSMSLNLIHSFLSTNKLHVTMQVENPFGSEDRAQKRLNLQIFKDDYLEMR